MIKLQQIDNKKADEVVKYYFQEWGDDEIDDFLWNETVHPFGCLEWLNEECYEFYLNNKQ